MATTDKVKILDEELGAGMADLQKMMTNLQKKMKKQIRNTAIMLVIFMLNLGAMVVYTFLSQYTLAILFGIFAILTRPKGL